MAFVESVYPTDAATGQTAKVQANPVPPRKADGALVVAQASDALFAQMVVILDELLLETKKVRLGLQLLTNDDLEGEK